MKQIDNYFFEDDFEYEEDTFFGVKLFCDGKSIYSSKQQMLAINAIGSVCTICGEFAEKYHTICSKCRDKKEQERYLALPVGEETEYLYSALKDEYFEKDDWDIIYDYLLECDNIENAKFSDLQIYPCNNDYANTIDIDDLFCDTHEDFDLESWKGYEELFSLIDEANIIIQNNPTGIIADQTKRIEISNKEWESLIKQAKIDGECNESNI